MMWVHPTGAQEGTPRHRRARGARGRPAWRRARDEVLRRLRALTTRRSRSSELVFAVVLVVGVILLALFVWNAEDVVPGISLDGLL